MIALQEMSEGCTNTASTANGLKEQFEKGKTVLGLVLPSSITGDLESLNTSLQCRTGNVSGMRAAVECVMQSFQVKRSDASFHSLRATQMVQDLDLDPIDLPRSRQPPRLHWSK